MKKLLQEKQSAFLRASVCDVCNFSCIYCAVDLGMENHTPKGINAPLLCAAEYIKNMEFIAQHGFMNISFTGGEPFLNPEFPQILKACRSIFKTIELTTNGTGLIESIELVKEYVDSLKISIDAIDDDLSKRIAGSPLAAKTPSVIEECCRRGVKAIGLNFVYMKQNRQELLPLMKFAHQLNQQYDADIGIRILDLYRSNGNRVFWQEEFVPLSEVRQILVKEGVEINRMVRFGCDSYSYMWNGLSVSMKDSITATTRATICDNCTEYCQEGIYSLKHSASGWISVCPSNSENLGTLLGKNIEEKTAHDKIDRAVEMINISKRIEQNTR